ncbi:carbohydrate ABC transporter permease [Paenibacillus xerothermodurans]|uniref:Carbohydrate ABC transporter permease n=1 Tax=Paenibacillus xerothermodurans TaxID=1977292 RepID=A0A2W1NYJ9_PAEXE|nr:carbohydrate ABC transporter permease [Paenibacillus xerothermodurans]PZE22816.1 carbohydrate ABC transporter permease [Paenibacillus xerothermodurans]
MRTDAALNSSTAQGGQLTDGGTEQTVERRAAAAVPWYRRRKAKALVGRTILTMLLAAGAFVVLLPLGWMVSISLKSMEDIMRFPPAFFPDTLHWRNYVEAWRAAPFTRYTVNSLVIAVLAVISHILSNTFVAYGFAKIRFKGKNVLFSVVLATMMIPGFVVMVPQYILFSKLHWVGTYLPLVVPGFFGSAFMIFMIRQFYMSVPNELIEAAKIDGANHLYIWWKIMMPISKPIIAAVGILAFNGAWNDFLGPLLYLNEESMYTLQIGLQSFRGSNTTQWNYLMAGSVLVLLPVIVLFFLFQKYFISGMNLTAGTKG